MTAALTSAEKATTTHLPFSRIIGYGFGDAGCNIAFQMTGLFLLVFYTDVVGIRPEHSGAIFLFIKIWDAFADIFAGRMVDRTMTRWGKFRPFLLWYAVPLLASNLLCFWAPFDDYWKKVGWAAATYALMGLLYSLVNIPYGSLAGAMSQDPVDRSRMASARMVGSGFTILVLSLFLAPAIKSANNLQHTFLVTSVAFFVVGSIFFAITFFTSKEVVYREVEKVSLRDTIETVKNNGPLVRLCGSSLFYLTGQNVVSAMGAYLGIDMLGRLSDGNWLTSAIMVITTGAVLYTGPFGPMVTRHLGKRNGFAVASAVAAAGLLIFWIGNSLLANLWVGLLGLFITGASMAVLNTMTWALEADTAEYGELKTGIRTEGATYAAFSFTRKVGQGVGMAIASWTLALASYDQAAGHAGQSSDTINSMGLWFAVFAGACFLGAGLIMLTYPLTEETFQEIMQAINSRRQQGQTISGRADGGHPENALGTELAGNTTTPAP